MHRQGCLRRPYSHQGMEAEHETMPIVDEGEAEAVAKEQEEHEQHEQQQPEQQGQDEGEDGMDAEDGEGGELREGMEGLGGGREGRDFSGGGPSFLRFLPPPDTLNTRSFSITDTAAIATAPATAAVATNPPLYSCTLTLIHCSHSYCPAFA